jgi:LysM repeat protein
VRLFSFALVGIACGATFAGVAGAFPHVAQRGDTLAGLAERFYGRVELEKVLVAANGLDAPSPLPVAPGMRLEIPATSHHRVATGESWASLAERFLGDARRAEALALANDSMPWLAPTVGAEIRVPYVLRYVVGRGDHLPGLAYRFLGKRDDAYVLDRFNDLGGRAVEPGEVLLVPLIELALTDEGREAAARAHAVVAGESRVEDRDAQERASDEIPRLEQEVSRGEWVAAIARGNQLTGGGRLDDGQEARVHRMLLEAYAALDEVALAERACLAMRRAAPDWPLDPIDTSPKVLAACTTAAAAPRFGPIPDDDAGAR